MRATRRYLVGCVLTVAALAIGITVAPVAEADCIDAGAATVCAQGSVSGQSTGSSSGPYFPYDCQDDWSCSNGPDSLFYGYGGLCETPYGTYQNCAVQGNRWRG
jgi:hypothetical protein